MKQRHDPVYVTDVVPRRDGTLHAVKRTVTDIEMDAERREFSDGLAEGVLLSITTFTEETLTTMPDCEDIFVFECRVC